MNSPMEELSKTVTQLLARWRDGDQEALERLMPLVYEELRRLARTYMAAENPGHTLQPTALVHEAYARLVNLQSPFRDRAHFLAVAATTMRHVLVDHARSKRAAKRGGNEINVALEEDPDAARPVSADILVLDEALDRLARVDERKAKVTELYYFGGLNYEEIAQVLHTSVATVNRDLKFAESWLHGFLSK